jgi:hypothetical protein
MSSAMMMTKFGLAADALGQAQPASAKPSAIRKMK